MMFHRIVFVASLAEGGLCVADDEGGEIDAMAKGKTALTL
jgi:hypothetical protein